MNQPQNRLLIVAALVWMPLIGLGTYVGSALVWISLYRKKFPFDPFDVLQSDLFFHSFFAWLIPALIGLLIADIVIKHSKVRRSWLIFWLPLLCYAINLVAISVFFALISWISSDRENWNFFFLFSRGPIFSAVLVPLTLAFVIIALFLSNLLARRLTK